MNEQYIVYVFNQIFIDNIVHLNLKGQGRDFSVRDTAQENVMNGHGRTRLFLVVVNQPKNITAISTRERSLDRHSKTAF